MHHSFCHIHCSFSHEKSGNHPNFRKKKRSRSETAVLRATLGIPSYSRSNSWNNPHGPVSYENPFLGAILGATPRIGWKHRFQRSFLKNWGGYRARHFVHTIPGGFALPRFSIETAHYNFCYTLCNKIIKICETTKHLHQ